MSQGREREAGVFESGLEQEAMAGRLWPHEGYARQVERVRAAVGQRIYLVEIAPSGTPPGVRLSDAGYELLDLIAFSRPDPARGIAPHLVLLDDGRGVNLGRIARISLERPFGPAPDKTLYQDAWLLQRLLSRERTFSEALVAERSRALLGEILGKEQVHRLIQTPAAIDPGLLVTPKR